jgi:hypothetical protein
MRNQLGDVGMDETVVKMHLKARCVAMCRTDCREYTRALWKLAWRRRLS